MLSPPVSWPIPLTPVDLYGQIVRLEVLTVEHEHDLSKICADEQIWRYLTSYGGTTDALHQYIQASLRDYRSGSALPFVIRNIADGKAIGMTRLKNLSREHRSAVVGSWLAATAWGTGVNSDSKLLLLTYAFESLHCIRIEFHTDSRNLRSRTALTRLGAHEEGTLRSCHITRDGSRRCTIVFSILDSEWPEVKQKLHARLDAQRRKVRDESRIAGSKYERFES